MNGRPLAAAVLRDHIDSREALGIRNAVDLPDGFEILLGDAACGLDLDIAVLHLIVIPVRLAVKRIHAELECQKRARSERHDQNDRDERNDLPADIPDGILELCPLHLTTPVLLPSAAWHSS